MSTMTRRSPLHDLVPLSERMRFLQGVRLVLATCALAYTVFVPVSARAATTTVISVFGAYVVCTLTAYGIWVLRSSRGRVLFGSLVLADSVFLVWACYITGGFSSPLRVLIVIHVVCTALLASYPTAMKIAFWDSLLLLAVHYAVEASFVAPADASRGLPGTDMQQLVVFVGLLWLATLATASFAAVNERELRRRKVDLEDLAKMASALEAALEPVHVATILHDALAEAYAFPQVAVIGIATDHAVPMAATRLRSNAPVLCSDVRGVLAEAWTTHERQLVATLEPLEDDFVNGLVGPARNLVVVPLFAEGRAVGAVVLEHGLRRGSRIERRVLTMVERFCAHAALALRNASLLERLRHVAATDELTDLANRRSFDDALYRELARGARLHQPTALVMADIDHFKRLNDLFGHQAGDRVLREVARTLADCSRIEDTVARYGGEEFAVVLPRCDLPSAVAFAERLRQAVRSLETLAPLTASFGVAVARADSPDPDAIIRAADAALYEAKRAGRDQVQSGHARPSETLP